VREWTKMASTGEVEAKRRMDERLLISLSIT
jgi:hypothetical protein